MFVAIVCYVIPKNSSAFFTFPKSTNEFSLLNSENFLIFCWQLVLHALKILINSKVYCCWLTSTYIHFYMCARTLNALTWTQTSNDQVACDHKHWMTLFYLSMVIAKLVFERKIPCTIVFHLFQQKIRIICVNKSKKIVNLKRPTNRLLEKCC